MARIDSSASNANLLHGLSAQITRMGESMASQNAAVSAFVDGQGALHSQIRQMASAINNLTEQMHRSYQNTSQRIDHLSGLIQHKSRHSHAQELRDSSSRVYAAVTDEARSLTLNRNRGVVPLGSGRSGAQQQQIPRVTSETLLASSAAEHMTRAVLQTAGTSLSPPEHSNDVNQLGGASSDLHASRSSLRLVSRPSTNGTPHGSSGSRLETENSRDDASSRASASLGAVTSPIHTMADSRDVAAATALGPLTTISPSELQALLRNVFSESPQKDHELFWRKARSIYIEHLGKRAPRRVSITHVSDAQTVFPKRYAYDKIIFVSTVPGEDALAILFDMKEKEVVIYDTVDRYRNNLFTFAKEKTVSDTTLALTDVTAGGKLRTEGCGVVCRRGKPQCCESELTLSS